MALVLAVACGLPLIPLILGIVALSQIRSRRENGKGLAIAAIVVSALTTALYAVILALGLMGYLDDEPRRDTGGQVTDPGISEVQDIRKGDCFNTDDGLEGEGEEGDEVTYSVDVVPCAEPHDAEAYAVFDLAAGPYPGVDEIAEVADEKCGALLAGYVDDPAKLPDSLEVYYYHPESYGWSLGDREVICFLGDSSNGRRTGSARDAAEGSAAEAA